MPRPRRRSILSVAALLVGGASVVPAAAGLRLDAWIVTGKAPGWTKHRCTSGAGAEPAAAVGAHDLAALAARFGGTQARSTFMGISTDDVDGAMQHGDDAIYLGVHPLAPRGDDGLTVSFVLQRFGAKKRMAEERITLTPGFDVWSAHPITGGSDVCVVALLQLDPPPPPPIAKEPAPSRGDPEFTPPLSSEVVPPKLVKRVDPEYPQTAKEGKVILQAVIDTAGKVAYARVLETPDPILAVSALGAVLQWRYEPARLRGEPVMVYYTVVVTYRR